MNIIIVDALLECFFSKFVNSHFIILVQELSPEESPLCDTSFGGINSFAVAQGLKKGF
jgi:hypothetical protein